MREYRVKPIESLGRGPAGAAGPAGGPRGQPARPAPGHRHPQVDPHADPLHRPPARAGLAADGRRRLPAQPHPAPARARRRRVAGRDRLARARRALPPAAVALGPRRPPPGLHGDAGDEQLAHLLRRPAAAAARVPGQHAGLGVRPGVPRVLQPAGVRRRHRPAAAQGRAGPRRWPATTRRCGGWWRARASAATACARPTSAATTRRPAPRWTTGGSPSRCRCVPTSGSWRRST